MARASNLERRWQGIREEAAACARCDLYECATQTVFGEGALDCSILFVGEQPGDPPSQRAASRTRRCPP